MSHVSLVSVFVTVYPETPAIVHWKQCTNIYQIKQILLLAWNIVSSKSKWIMLGFGLIYFLYNKWGQQGLCFK